MTTAGRKQTEHTHYFETDTQRKTTSIKTGLYLKENDWDAQKSMVKSSYKGTTNVTRLNNEIQKKKSRSAGWDFKVEEKAKKNPLSVTDVKQQIDSSVSRHSFATQAMMQNVPPQKQMYSAKCAEIMRINLRRMKCSTL